MSNKPEKIYLQWYGDGVPEIEDPAGVNDDDVTWCRDEIFKHDIAYIRQDIADERVRVARREVWDAVARLADALEPQKLGPLEDVTAESFDNGVRHAGRFLKEQVRIARNAAEGEGE